MKLRYWIIGCIISFTLGFNIILPILTGKNAFDYVQEAFSSQDKTISIGDDQNNNSNEPFIYFNSPENSFGSKKSYIINDTFFWNIFINSSGTFNLEKSANNITWQNDNVHMSVGKIQLYDSFKEKYWFNISLFKNYYYKLSYKFDWNLKDYNIDNRNKEALINYTVGNEYEIYTCYFNWSKILPLNNFFLKANVENNKFVFSIQTNIPLPYNKNIDIDPIFGLKSWPGDSRSGINGMIRGGNISSPDFDGFADNITAVMLFNVPLTPWPLREIKFALYDVTDNGPDGAVLIAQTNTTTVSGLSIQPGNRTLDFPGKIFVDNDRDYVIVAWANSTNGVALCYENTVGIQSYNITYEYETNYPTPINFNDTVDISYIIYCSYNPSNWTNVSNWNGTLYNKSTWKQINNFNGTLYNLTIRNWNEISQWNGSIYNISASIIYVDDDFTSATSGWGWNHFDTIQNATQNSSDGVIIYVWEGTYYVDNLIIDKSTTLIGNSSSNTTINSSVDVSTCLDLRDYYMNIFNFTFQGDVDNCIRDNSYAGNHNISNNVFENNKQSIVLIDSSSNIVRNNTFLNNSGFAAIYIYQFSELNEISYNNITNSTTCGISIESQESENGNTIYNNSINTYSDFGIEIIASTNNKIYNNTIINTDVGIRITDISDNTLIYNNYIDAPITINDVSSGTNYYNISKTSITNIIGGPYIGGNYYSNNFNLHIGNGFSTQYPINSSSFYDYLPIVYPQWSLINQWNGSIYNVSFIQWQNISNWNGTIYNITTWNLVNSLNGSIYNQTLWNSINIWNGTIFNETIYNLISDWNGTIFNQSNWNLISQWNGTIYNKTLYNLIDIWNGSVYNISLPLSYKEVDNWNGTVYNLTTEKYWKTINTWNGTLYNRTEKITHKMSPNIFLAFLIFPMFIVFYLIKKRKIRW